MLHKSLLCRVCVSFASWILGPLLTVTIADYWVFTIAVCTFLILANYKNASTWVQEHKIVVWALPWGLSFLWAALGQVRVGYGYIGACKDPRAMMSHLQLTQLGCWFTSDRVRLLVNFIPRWIIILAILAIYTRLYQVMHRAEKGMMSEDEDMPVIIQTSAGAFAKANATKNFPSTGSCSGSETQILPPRRVVTVRGGSPNLKRVIRSHPFPVLWSG